MRASAFLYHCGKMKRLLLQVWVACEQSIVNCSKVNLQAVTMILYDIRCSSKQALELSSLNGGSCIL